MDILLSTTKVIKVLEKFQKLANIEYLFLE